MSISIVVEKEEVKSIAGNALDVLVKERNNKPLLMLLSGGSSLELVDFIKDASIESGITFGMLDDRYDTDPDINSFQKITHTQFYLRALRKGALFLDSSVYEQETLETYAERYEQQIKKWIKRNPNGIIRATVGIGPDGHTSGILPHPEDPQKFQALFNTEKFIIGYDVGAKNPHRFRMTSTFTLMKKFDRVLTYMTGKNKHDALQKVLAEEGDIATTPGRIIRELQNVQLFTDITL